MKHLLKKPFLVVFNLVKKSGATIKWFLKTASSSDMKNHVVSQDKEQLLTILANGPSLNDDLKNIDFTHGDFSVVNDFFISPYYKKIKPQYHVLMDPLYFKDDHYLEPIIETVDWDLKLFVPYYACKSVNLLRNMPNKYIEVIPCILVPYNGFECLRYWIYQHGLAIPRLQNVLVASIFTGVNMGYKDIKLYGVDHSWLESIRVNNKNEVCLIDSHFYDTEEVKFLPWHKASGEQYKMHEVLRDLAQMFDSYHQLQKYADYRCCKIVNCTKGSYIDAFEREYTSL